MKYYAILAATMILAAAVGIAAASLYHPPVPPSPTKALVGIVGGGDKDPL